MDTAVSETSTHPGRTLTIEGCQYDILLFTSCEDPLFPEVPGSSIFFSRSYHRSLLTAPPERMKFLYIRIETEGELAGMLCFQLSDLSLGKSLKPKNEKGLINKIRSLAASRITLKVLCLGNTLVTGDYGFCFVDHIPSKVRTQLMMQTIDWMLELKELRNTRLVFVKDFYHDIFQELPESPYCKTYHAIDTQPSMIMDIPDHWGDINGYLSTIKSKYRVRANKAIEKSALLRMVELDAEEIEVIEDYLHSLYMKVVEDVGFNLFILPVGYFSALKRELGNKFHLWVHKENGEIISFFTAFEDGDILDAHFLGYEPEVNHQHKLYLNMLLSLIDFAAKNKFRQLQLSRTASEIKSSVGAIGVPMWAYLRFPNRLLNGWMPSIYSFFKPDLKWVPRNPFHGTPG